MYYNKSCYYYRRSAPTIDAITPQQATCGEDNASVIITVSGGAGAYSYSLDNALYQTSNQFENLPAGNYTIYIEDGNSCPLSQVFVIGAAGIPTIDNTQESVPSCGAQNGSITVTASGGQGALEYSLDGITYQSSNQFNMLEPGSYTVRVRDANLCVVESSSIPLTDAASPNIDDVEVAESTCGNADGLIRVIALGGTGVKTYSINGVDFQISNEFSNLTAGTYDITVRDENNCEVTATAVDVQDASSPAIIE